ncbi:MAG: phytanoyl-CoA dioxygenase family protein [Planctomycetia bacterium]|nr:phytanoyl-CoA dioxygenase family protein [Planctomycetia bacterium]
MIASATQYETLEGLTAWVNRRLPVDELKMISDHPWARTYRVRSNGETYYLKSLPSVQRCPLSGIELLSRRFEDAVPSVVAFDATAGLLLLRDHGGVERQDDDSLRGEVLSRYASLQSEASRQADLLDLLPSIELAGLVDRFCEFLDPKGSPTDGVGAEHFLGAEQSRFFFDRIAQRKPQLQRLVLEAIRLPETINHLDLRMQNVAVREDGSVVLFDWDEATAGPAGMSLHNFFSGCSVPFRILRESDAASSISSRQRTLLARYMATLVEQGYASHESLVAGLPGSILAGVLHYLLSYRKFPMKDADDRAQVAKIIVRRLDDVLTLCDHAAIALREAVITCLDDYEEADAPQRARYLLEQYLSGSPDDIELRLRLAHVWNYLGDDAAAEAACRQALDADSRHAEARALLGRIFVERLQLDDAVDQLRLASSFAPGDESARRRLDDALLMQELERHAAQPGRVPTIRFTPDELRSGIISRAKRRLTARLFRKYGTLVVENVFDEALMDRLLVDFSERYRSYLDEGRPDDALKVGNKRFMITVDVDGRFNDPALYSAPLLTPILARLLSDEYVMGSFTAVASMPGAAEMRVHKDHPALFDDEALSFALPTTAVTTLIPLRGFDLVMGTTRVWKGSHTVSSAAAAEMEYQDPCAPKGSCLLMDYRLSHQGLANRSQVVRPVLSVVYNRPWFRDSVNYELQAPLRMSRAEFERVPEPSQRLFAWTKP